VSVRLPNPLSAVVWLAFFLPSAAWGGWLDRAFGGAVFVLACSVLVSKASPWEARKPSLLAAKFFFFLQLLAVFSFLYSAAFNGVQFAARGWFDLARPALLGAFVVYLIRHYDARVRAAMEWAMLSAVYAALFIPSVDPRGYAALLTLCWLLFFSRLRLRFVHASAALVVVFFSDALAAWTAALFVLDATLAVGAYRALARRKHTRAVALSFGLYLLLLGGAAAGSRLKPGAESGVAAAAAPARALRQIAGSPVFGWGPAERDGSSSTENQYIRWLLESGMLGTAAILLGMLVAGFRLLSAVHADVVHLAGAAAFLAAVAMMLAAGPYLETFKLFFLTAIFMAGIKEAGR
jgi:hypothetical protein